MRKPPTHIHKLQLRIISITSAFKQSNRIKKWTDLGPTMLQTHTYTYRYARLIAPLFLLRGIKMVIRCTCSGTKFELYLTNVDRLCLLSKNPKKKLCLMSEASLIASTLQYYQIFLVFSSCPIDDVDLSSVFFI